MKSLKQTIAFCALTACLFTGCSGSSNTSEDTKVTATETPSPTPIATIDPKISTDNIMGIYIGEQQAQLGLGLDTATIKEILGKADEIKKTKDGKDKTDNSKKAVTQSWYYKDLDTTIIFDKTGDTYTVSSISGGKKATTLKTGGGITTGSSREDIVKAYKEQLGEDADTGKDKIVIDNMGYSQIVFTIDNDVVVGITMELL